jgi:hypothetical protein
MAGQYISDASGYEATEFDTKIPSLTDQANVVEAFKLYHYGIDNYSGTGAPASDSMHAHLKDINDRLTEVETTSVTSLSGTLNEITVSASIGAVTVGLPDDVTITDDLTVGGDLLVSGDLTVSGSVTYINVSELQVEDPMIYLAGNSSANLVDIGFVGNYNDGSYHHTGLVKDATDGYWKFFSSVESEPTTVIAFDEAVYDTVVMGSASVQNSITASSATLNTITSVGPSDIRIPINAQTASAYTLVLSDVGKMVEMNNSSSNTVTVPPNSSEAIAVGSQITILQTGTGQTTIAAGVGVTVNGSPGLKLRAQWTSATLIKRATNTWVAIGDLAS